MCLAIPAQIIALEKYSAKVDIMGVEGEVNIQLIEEPKVGDYILVHAGCAIQGIDSEYFDYLQKVFQEVIEGQCKDE
jgi:hydrogenase expression/formation protein HypC